MAENDIVGDTVRNTYNSAMEKPRQIMKTVSDAADSVTNKVKSFLPKPPETVIDNRGSNLKPSSPAPTGSPAKPHKMPKYHKGTDYVPKTGPAVLKKGEAVLNTKEAAEHRAMKHGMDSVASELGGKSEKPKKEIKHIVTKKAKTGGYIHEHHHTAPEHHPMEEHVSPNQDAMVEHMMQHMGTPNDGEEAAEGAADNPKEEAMESHGSPQMPM